MSEVKFSVLLAILLAIVIAMTGSAAVYTERHKPAVTHQAAMASEFDEPEAVDVGEQTFMQVTATILEPQSLAIMGASLPAYHKHCAPLDSTILQEARLMRLRSSAADARFADKGVAMLIEEGKLCEITKLTVDSIKVQSTKK